MDSSDSRQRNPDGAEPNASKTDPRVLAEAFYDRLADDYLTWETVPWPRMRWLEKVLDRLEPGSRVLDLGCGSGDPADIEIARNHRVTGVDHSIAQIERARSNVPSGEFIRADFLTRELHAESFAAVVSFYALDAVPRREHAAVFARIHALLRPAAQHGANGQGIGDRDAQGNDDDDIGLRR